MNSIPRRGLRVVSAEPTQADTVEVHVLDLLDGPTPQELAAIEAEWPQIEADILALDDLDETLLAVDALVVDLDSRRARRTRRRIIAATLSGAATFESVPVLRAVA
ncbi:hypothetical protein Lfu02_32560 [Longispora fulva]|uniref:Uncharacterized protein n=1 Tax=Longispora fulva TaxID=619741 RepID=A0A8J7GLY4_9ACTN|nr:DUF6284 family protein [Longispora fulva]MBG6139387.1 hypothetical protein [Longispora fulva]GIG58884.1 hypothetical protein Lfu02_32560 [Longispora fulva]